MNFSNLIQVHLLRGRQIAFSDYESRKRAKKRDHFVVLKMDLSFQISQGTKHLTY